nr:uncharacterized protein LOC105711572 [Aotus nancymaae]
MIKKGNGVTAQIWQDQTAMGSSYNPFRLKGDGKRPRRAERARVTELCLHLREAFSDTRQSDMKSPLFLQKYEKTSVPHFVSLQLIQVSSRGGGSSCVQDLRVPALTHTPPGLQVISQNKGINSQSVGLPFSS